MDAPRLQPAFLRNPSTGNVFPFGFSPLAIRECMPRLENDEEYLLFVA